MHCQTNPAKKGKTPKKALWFTNGLFQRDSSWHKGSISQQMREHFHCVLSGKKVISNIHGSLLSIQVWFDGVIVSASPGTKTLVSFRFPPDNKFVTVKGWELMGNDSLIELPYKLWLICSKDPDWQPLHFSLPAKLSINPFIVFLCDSLSEFQNVIWNNRGLVATKMTFRQSFFQECCTGL